MIRRNAYLFRAMPTHCMDNNQCRQMLLTVAWRLQTLRRPKYGGEIDGQCVLQLMKLYRELHSEDYVGAYSRLRHIAATANLCSSEMTAIIIQTLKQITEDNVHEMV